MKEIAVFLPGKPFWPTSVYGRTATALWTVDALLFLGFLISTETRPETVGSLFRALIGLSLATWLISSYAIKPLRKYASVIVPTVVLVPLILVCVGVLSR